MEHVLESYYKDNAKKLHMVINKIFDRHYGGIVGKDMEEFYGIGTDVLIDIWVKFKQGKSTYDSSKGDFDGYVYKALSMAIIDEFKKRNRDKRSSKIYLLDKNGDKILDEKTGKPIKISIQDVYLDAPVREGESITYGDTIQSNFSMDEILFEDFHDENVEKFLCGLPKTSRQIIEMKMKDIPVSAIKAKLNISDKDYTNYMSYAKMNENLALFTKMANRYVESS